MKIAIQKDLGSYWKNWKHEVNKAGHQGILLDFRDKKGFESFNSGVNSLLDAGDFTYALDIVNQNASNLTGAELDEFRTTIQNRRNGWESDTTHPNVAQRN